MLDTVAQNDRWASRPDRLRHRLREQGIFGIAGKIRRTGWQGCIAYSVRQIRYSLCIALSRRWDRTYGVDTGGQIEPKDLEVVGPNQLRGAAAVSTSPRTFSFLSRHFPRERADFTYIDIGAGKGRTLLLASRLGFKRVIGVEFSAYLCAKAEANIALFNGPRGQGDFSIVLADATQYELPPEKLVLYFNNPFGLDLWPAMIENIVGSLKRHPRALCIVLAGSQPQTIRGAGELIAARKEFVSIAAGTAPFYPDTYRPYHFVSFASCLSPGQQPPS